MISPYIITAVNTAGLWYAMVFNGDTIAYSSKAGYADRQDAIWEGNRWFYRT